LKGFLLAEFLPHGDVSSMKRELIAAKLTLTDSESTRLWQVYEQYSAELSKVSDTRTTILEEYSGDYDTLTDDQADDLIRRWLETDVEQAKLRQQFARIFRKVLPGKKAATFLQLERRISMMMDVQLTSKLPLAQSEV
jgi:Spy/CpxP family protein refolding chaperone